MKPILFLALALALYAIPSQAQTIAPNFNVQDCNGTSHDLYAELAAGKVVVICWVMPCGPCIGPAKTAYNISQSYANSHPGRVLYYLFDDLGDYPCNSLKAWATNNGIGPNIKAFSTSSVAESDYGGVGMPHVAVVSGLDARITYNGFNSTAADVAGIKGAIDAGLLSTSVPEESSTESFSVIPNPAVDEVQIELNGDEFSEMPLRIFNVAGVEVSPSIVSVSASGSTVTLSVQSLATGVYQLQCWRSGKWISTSLRVVH